MIPTPGCDRDPSPFPTDHGSPKLAALRTGSLLSAATAEHVAATLSDHYLWSMANYLLKLFGPKRNNTTERLSLGELDVAAHDDMAAIKRLKDTFPDRLSECDCAELYGPDGRLVWERSSDSRE